MTNPKIEKIDAEIEKTKKKILEQQAKLRRLERQRIDEENAEIIAFYRKEIQGDSNIAELMRQKYAAPPAEIGERYAVDEGEEVVESEVRA